MAEVMSLIHARFLDYAKNKDFDKVVELVKENSSYVARHQQSKREINKPLWLKA